MNRKSLSRALLAGMLVAAGAAQAESNLVTQTWFFPDGSNHTVMLDGRTSTMTAGAPDTTVLGAGPANSTSSMLDDTWSDEASNVSTQTWFFPDGSNHTIVTPLSAR